MFLLCPQPVSKVFGMKQELIEQYFTNLRKFENDQWTSQQWFDYCFVVLSELMEEHKDVFIRLKSLDQSTTNL